MAAVQASITMLAAVEVGEAAEFGLHGLPQGLADDPELRMFDDLPIVERTEVRTATAGQRVLTKMRRPKTKRPMYFSFSRMTRTPLEAHPLRRGPRRVGSAGNGTICSLSRCAISHRLTPLANHRKI